MDYKITPPERINSNESGLDVFCQKDGIIYFANKKIDISYDIIQNFPIILQSINTIEKEVAKFGFERADIYVYLKKIDDIILTNSIKPYPTDLAKLFLQALFNLVSNSLVNEITRVISLRIINFISLSTNETFFCNNYYINIIIKIISKKKPLIILDYKSDNYTKMLMYSLSILENLLNIPSLTINMYMLYKENYLLQILNDKLSDLYSEPLNRQIFDLTYQMLKLSTHNQEIKYFSFLIPSLLKIIPCFGKNQKMSLKCLLLFLQDQECLQKCIQEKINSFLYEYISVQNIDLFLKCIIILCLNEHIYPFNSESFYQKIIDFIDKTNAKGMHEILNFCSLVIQFDPKFNQNLLFQKIFESIERHDYNYQFQCIDFIIAETIENYLNISDELRKTIILYILSLIDQLPNETIIPFLNVIDMIISKKDNLSKDILANQMFLDFLNECLSDTNTDPNVLSMSSLILSKIN